MLQVGAGKWVCFHLGDTAGVHVLPQQGAKDQAQTRFSFAASAGDDKHFLPFCGGNEAVAYKLLEGQNVVRLQKVSQKRQPLHWRRGIRHITDRQAVDTEILCL